MERDKFYGAGPLPIERDQGRFREIVKGRVRKDLQKHIGNSGLIGRKGKDLVSIPVPNIELPHFRFGGGQGGVGQGEGNEGDPIGRGGKKGGTGKAGDQPGEHLLEVEMTFEELLDLFLEEARLPNIKPTDNGNIFGGEMWRVKSIRTQPEPWFHFKRSYRNALKETADMPFPQNVEKAVLISRARPHARSRSIEKIRISNARAAVFFLEDISGSINDKMRELERLITFWFCAILDKFYPEVVRRFIVHEAVAKEVDQDTFFAIKASGGTKISSAYELMLRTMAKDYPPDEWNVFGVHFSDGDNWNNSDDEVCQRLLDDIVPLSRVFAFVGTRVTGRSDFISMLNKIDSPEDEYTTAKRFVVTKADEREDVYGAILDICGRKKEVKG